MTLPAEFLQRMVDLLGTEEYDAFRRALERPARTCLRTNALKLSPEDLAERLGLSAEPLPWAPEALLLPPDLHLGRHPLHAAGLFYLQEPSATAAVPLLDPRPGERVLDLCAAPGGKATHIAARLAGRGLLWANEIVPARARVLAGNLERWGARSAVVSVEPPDHLAERLPGYFDRVLVDAPCSGEGLFRRDPAAAREWSPAIVQGCALRQQHILQAAAHMVRPGGVVVYATCTFSPQENEGVIGEFLQARPDFTVEDAPRGPGFGPGLPEALPGLPAPLREQLARTVRLWPHHLPGEGHFMARLRQEGEAPAAALPDPAPVLGRAERRLWDAFRQESLPGLPPPSALILWGRQLYALPPGLPDLAGLRLLRPGWPLGRLRRERFVPAHALAMAVPAEAAAETLDLDPRDPATAAYLRGETLNQPGRPGWLLVTVDGYPLGWGKRVGSVVKNHLPKALRQNVLSPSKP